MEDLVKMEGLLGNCQYFDKKIKISVRDRVLIEEYEKYI